MFQVDNDYLVFDVLHKPHHMYTLLKHTLDISQTQDVTKTMFTVMQRSF